MAGCLSCAGVCSHEIARREAILAHQWFRYKATGVLLIILMLNIIFFACFTAPSKALFRWLLCFRFGQAPCRLPAGQQGELASTKSSLDRNRGPNIKAHVIFTNLTPCNIYYHWGATEIHPVASSIIFHTLYIKYLHVEASWRK